MLRNMRNVGRTWIGKVVAGVLFTLLILSFAVWGIGDIFRGGASTTIARVGETEITAEMARQTYQDQVRRLSIQIGQPITPADARALGLDRQVLSSLITEATLDERARRMGLAVSNELVARAIMEDPTFQDGAGNFDRNRFQALLRNVGLTEERYLFEQRDAVAREQIIGAVAADITAPVAAMEAVHRFGAERREARFVILDENAVGTLPSPSEDALAAFHQENLQRYRAPEYRAATVLAVSLEDLADPQSVSEDQARAVYEREGERRFGAPERRQVQRIQFSDEAEARDAARAIEIGQTDFASLAEERGIARDVFEMGLMTRDDFIDRALADAAFALDEGEISEPVAGRFGHSLVRVVRIEDGRVLPFEDVEAEIRAEIAIEEARDRIRRVYDEIEDQRATGRPLEEIARERGLDPRLVDAVDAQGRDPAGNRLDLPRADRLISEIFDSDIGIDNAALRTDEGGYIWFDVTGVQPARNRELSEVRDAVIADWRRDQIAERLREVGNEKVERLRSGESLETVAEDIGGVVAQADNLARGQTSEPLDAGAVRAIFATRVGAPGTAPIGETRRIVFTVESARVTPFLTTTPAAETIGQRLQRDIAEDLLTQFIAQLQDDVGVSVNEQAYREAIGLDF
ncbi:MAG: SurA N-terminal domain-containing protein [Salinarimonas sp.]